MCSAPHSPAQQLPIARVLPLLGLSHLDREFDYRVTEAQADDAQVGTRVRVRFGGKLVDGIVTKRVDASDYKGSLQWLKSVYSPEVVLPQRLWQAVERVATRYAGARSDVIRMALPARHARAEKKDTSQRWEDLGPTRDPDLSEWSAYHYGDSFVRAVLDCRTARCAWQITPGEHWAHAVAALAVKTVLEGHGALVVVPDARDMNAVYAAALRYVAACQVTLLHGTELGAEARYQRFLSILRGQGKLVIGTRSAAWAPVADLQLAIVLFDGDENLADPRAPYCHAREVLTTRSAIEGFSLIIGGHSRTAETQLMVESGWLHGLEPSREIVRARSPRIQAVADSDFELEKDPRARATRIPAIGFSAIREAAASGRPALIHNPRSGYIPVLACRSCRTPARCRHCHGPLGIPERHNGTGDPALPTCRWCGRVERHFCCPECGDQQLRSVVLGVERTAAELGRAFSGVRVMVSGGERVVSEVPEEPGIVVATPGAEPDVAGGGYYGAALILDTWAMLGRQDLRATEEAFARWCAVTAKVAPHREGGRVIVVAEPHVPVVQELIRWDPVAAARRELGARGEAGFPPTVHIAAVDGSERTVLSFLEEVELPEDSESLGPVSLPMGCRPPAHYNEADYGPAQRLLIRVPVRQRDALGTALKSARARRTIRGEEAPMRIQVDPLHIG